jgi:hypothetical protein
MKKMMTAILLAAALLIGCTGCADKAPDVTTADIGSEFLMIPEYITGSLSYTVNSVQWSDNVKELGVDPNELSEYSTVSYAESDSASYSWPDYVDLETGQLADHLRFVLVELTVTNIDAYGMTAPVDEGGTPDASWYAFGVNMITLCDLNTQGDYNFLNYNCVWYGDTGDYAPQEGGTNGSDYFLLWPGESLTYRMGFVVGSSEDDFSGICLTDGGGSYHSDQAVYIDLGMERGD